MQAIYLTGRVGGDAEVRAAGNSEVTSFSLAVDQGYGDKKTTNWYRVSIWGDRGRKLSGHITKGIKIAVSGDLEIGEYQGKQQLNVRANDVDPFMSSRQSDGAGSSDRPAPAAYADDLDSTVPF